MNTAHDFTFYTASGDAYPLSALRGKPFLLVNTASRCGFTPQYRALEALYQRYKDQGFQVIAVPSNDFGHQEPGSDPDIQSFCQVNYGLSFPVLRKESVSGKQAHPFYRWAKTQLGLGSAPKWNFHKYLIDGEGHLVDFFLPTTSPESAKVVNKIEVMLRGG
jgi:glutathione peroxidase